MDFNDLILSDKIKVNEVQFYLCPELWTAYNFSDFSLPADNWKEVKFLNDDGTGLSDAMQELPDDSGGIYIFIIKATIIESISEYLVYIGRAKYTTSHNLNVRCRKYFYEYFDAIRGRPKVTRMVHKWGNYLYIKYTSITNNEQIERLEAELINALLPPFNHEIPEKKYKRAIRAFK